MTSSAHRPRARPLTLIAALLAVALLALGAAVTAEARERLVQVPSKGPGPDRFDRVGVLQIGPKKPRQVLVLMAGTAGGAGDFTLLARDLVRRVPGLAVWAVDRRSQPLEDTAMFAAADRREVSLDAMFDHYLGWLVNGGSPPDHFQFLDTSTVPFAKRWGMRVALRDVRKVIARAKRGNRQVLLGGHSLGASLAAAYAAWDFRGKPGYRGIDGIVMIDGGLLGSFDAYDAEQAAEQLGTLDSEPFLDLLGLGIPEAAGLFAEAGGMYAKHAPLADASKLQSFPLLPPSFRPPVPVTNRALLAHSFDRDTSPAELRLLHVNAGGLAPAGSPRDWLDGGITPAANIARTFGQEPVNAVEWYFPRRLTIDTNGADAMRRNEVARLLGLRLHHTRRIDLPIYAFGTDLTDGDVVAGARRLVRRARTPKRKAMIVDGAPRQSHLDPLTAAPADNRFARSAARFLRRVGR